jgi:HPr kinase/phosphorylase
MTHLTVAHLLAERDEHFELTPLTGQTGLHKAILTSEIHRPGLALAGYTSRFPNERAQVLGETELSYLHDVDATQRRQRLEALFQHPMPFLVATKGIQPPTELVEIASANDTAVLATRLSTTEFVYRLSVYLDSVFALRTSQHGTLVDVYGVGLIYTGRSGIGKSECALDLVERGHRLVADDVVNITKKGPDVIVGQASDILGHHMEVRGIGILDIERLFGIRSVRLQKRIEVVVKLERWEEGSDYERLGLEEKSTQILGVEVPVVTIPVSPGKNITVISEVIAMNHMLKMYGENTAERFSQRLAEEIKRRRATGGYLEADTE